MRWPMPFTLRPCDASLWDRAPARFDLTHDYAAPPGLVHQNFLGLVGDPPWAPGFLGLDWLTEPKVHREGARFDERYTFMTMQVRLVEHVPARRTVMSVERWSLPLATEMVQIIELEPLGTGTRLHYQIGYRVPTLCRPFHPPVAALFRWWFRVSLQRLARVCDTMVAAG